MSGNPHECRLHAERCSRLAQDAPEAKRRLHYTELAKMWTRLAAEIESDNRLLGALSELESSAPYDALPRALKLCA